MAYDDVTVRETSYTHTRSRYVSPAPTPAMRQQESVQEGQAFTAGLDQYMDGLGAGRIAQTPNRYDAQTLALLQTQHLLGRVVQTGEALLQAQQELRSGHPAEILDGAALDRLMGQ